MMLGQGGGNGEEIVAEGLTAGDWIQAGAVFVAGILLGRLLRALVSRAVQRGDSEWRAAQLAGRLAGYVLVIAGLVYALSSLDVRLGPLLGALGLGGLAIAFAAQSIIENFFASIILMTRRPFRRGDQILTNDLEGTVEDVNFRTVVLRTYDGERVLVPAVEVLQAPITNHTSFGLRRTTLPVAVAYDTDLPTARRVLDRAVRSVEGVSGAAPPEVYVEEFADSGITIALRYWHAPDIATLWRVRNDVALAAKAALDEAGITIPFPQRTLWFGGAPEQST